MKMTNLIQATGATTSMRSQPITELILPWIDPSQFPHIKQSLQKHGGNVTIRNKEYHLSFPEGTVQHNLTPMVGVPRQKIVFPDGWWLLYEKGDRGRLPAIVIDPPEGEEPQ